MIQYYGDFINEITTLIDGLNTYLITKMIKQHNPNNNVCLSGLGLDELLRYKYKKKFLLYYTT